MEFQRISDDLQQIFPEHVTLPPPPYHNEEEFQEKFTKILKTLQKSIKQKQQILSLVNAYYLGQLLDQVWDSSKRFKYKKTHYATIAEKSHDLFELYPEK
jgi:hypothetical protein